MNIKELRKYQRKAECAFQQLEALGFIYKVGEGKPPRWEGKDDRITATEIRESVAKADREATERANALHNEFMAQLVKNLQDHMNPPKPEPVKDAFETGPQTFPDRHRYIGRTAKLLRIPSWHGCPQALIGSVFTVDEIKFTTKSNYSGYTVAGYLMGQKVWFPLSCVKF